MLEKHALQLPEVLVFTSEVKEDPRGMSRKLLSHQELLEVGVEIKFLEVSLYCPIRKGTLYGIHFQNHPKPQTKLLTCVRGSGLDYSVDLRRESPTFGQWVSVELTPESRRQVLVPAGFGHAFLSLEDDTQVAMAIDEYFDPALARSIAYNDPFLKIDYPVKTPILIDYDQTAPLLKDSDVNF